MSSTIVKTTTFIFLATTFSQQLWAQQDFGKYEVGLNVGTFIYQGDLTPEKYGAFKTARLGVGLTGTRILSPAFSVRANVNFGSLRGDDSKYSDPEYRQQRNFKFSSPLTEVSALLIYDVFKNNDYRESGSLSPYVFGGIDYSFVNIKRDYSNMDPKVFPAEGEVMAGLSQDIATTLPRHIVTFPVGVGVRKYLGANFSVNLETSYRLMHTDYLDGFSRSVNPDKGDHYHYTSVGLIYSFRKKGMLGCPKAP